MSNLRRKTESKIVMVVVDGLGGMSDPAYGQSELQCASTPNLDKLAAESSCGLTTPVLPGITPGSGPGHMALFGYNPVKYLLGRGILEGMGIGADIVYGDLAARGNFCQLDQAGNIVDRRAGRIPTDESLRLIEELNLIELNDVSFEVHSVMDYRFVLVLKGGGISPDITDTDPQIEGVPISVSQGTSTLSQRTSAAVNEFTEKAVSKLSKISNQANGILLRGFSVLPDIPNFSTTYGLKAAAIAGYPMYRGLAGMVGMTVLECGQDFSDELEVLEKNFSSEYDYFFLHYKPADSAGEDGDFESKVRKLEAFDAYIPKIRALGPDVIVVCGDHATPSLLSGHSWHPVPFLINSRHSVPSNRSFDEESCKYGSIGSIQAEHLMLSTLANAGKLHKYGA